MCTKGKNGPTELQCAPHIPLEHIVRVVVNPYCRYDIKDVYMQFLTHCFVDTDAEMKEMYGGENVEKVFESILSDIIKVHLLLSSVLRRTQTHTDTTHMKRVHRRTHDSMTHTNVHTQTHTRIVILTNADLRAYSTPSFT